MSFSVFSCPSSGLNGKEVELLLIDNLSGSAEALRLWSFGIAVAGFLGGGGDNLTSTSSDSRISVLTTCLLSSFVFSERSFVASI